MNLQQVIRVAARAAIVALCLTGAGLLPAPSAAGTETVQSPAVAHQHESRAVKWVTSFGVLNQLKCCLLQRLGLGWFWTQDCWVCDQRPTDIYRQVPPPGRFDSQMTDGD